MKHLKKFETKADEKAWRKSDEAVIPNVVYTESKVGYNKAAIKNGVFIQHKDSRLFTEEEWLAAGYSGEMANGVAVIDDTTGFVVSKYDIGKFQWGGHINVDGIFTTTNSNSVRYDIEGRKNTEAIIAQLKGVTDEFSGIVGAPAAEACANYIFPNKQNGYLPAMREVMMMESNRKAINNLLGIIGGDELGWYDGYSTEFIIWSSSQESKDYAWAYFVSFSKDARVKAKSDKHIVRPVTEL